MDEAGPDWVDDDYCYLTTVGRVSGRPHRIEIWFAAAGRTLYLLAGGGLAADWVANLVARPTVQVELGGRTREAVARLVETGAESDRARVMVFAKYAARTDDDLTRWRDVALPVALDLDAEGSKGGALPG